MSGQESETASEDQPSSQSLGTAQPNVNVTLISSVTSADENKGSDSDGDGAEEVSLFFMLCYF